MRSGIYQILNKSNGKFYIGSAVNIKRRWAVHVSTLNKGTHKNIYLQRAWNKHWFPEEIFEFKILEYCAIENLLEREQSYLDNLKPYGDIGYNILPSAGNSSGLKHTDEAKLKMSAIAKVRKFSEITRAKMSAIRKGRKQPDKFHLTIAINRAVKNEAALMFLFDKELVRETFDV